MRPKNVLIIVMDEIRTCSELRAWLELELCSYMYIHVLYMYERSSSVTCIYMYMYYSCTQVSRCSTYIL